MRIGLSSMSLVPRVVLPSESYIEQKKQSGNLNIGGIETDKFSNWELLSLNWVYESLVFAEKENFDFLEIILESPINNNKNTVDAFIKICNSFKIMKTVHAPFLQNNIIIFDTYMKRGSIDELLDAFPICKRIAAKKVTIHPGNPTMKMPYLMKYYQDSLLESAKLIGEQYHSKYKDDFILCMENMPLMTGFFMKNEEIVNNFNTPQFKHLKLTLDSSHGWTNGGDDNLEQLARALSKKIAHVHLVDNLTFDNDPHIPIGTGKIDFPRFLKTLQDVGYNDTLVIEMPGIKNTLESRKLIKNMLKI
jgi:sugar phosphate isomerase/epimerase